MELDLVLATRNAGKVAELRFLLAEARLPVTVRVLGLEDFPHAPDVEETEATFEGNALLKARAVSLATGKLAMADDSGLEVDALGGAPGVLSARYAGPFPEGADGREKDRANNDKLLAALAHLADAPEARGCRFVSVVALHAPDGRELVARGVWEGRVGLSPQGQGGFGYDPLFVDPQAGVTAAALSPAEKNARSHRGQALRRLLEQLPAFLDAPTTSATR